MAEGCGNTKASAPATTPVTPSSTEGGPPPWAQLAASLSGSVVLPADPTYGVDKLLYNERFDALAPAAIAYCHSAGRRPTMCRLRPPTRRAAVDPLGWAQLRRLLLGQRLDGGRDQHGGDQHRCRCHLGRRSGPGFASSTSTPRWATPGCSCRGVRARRWGSPASPSAAGSACSGATTGSPVTTFRRSMS